MQAISTKQLRYFHALSRLKHFGKAADYCAVTQPALSMQIKDLEHILGLSLVVRGKSKITLTPDGEEIALRAEKILADIQDIGDYAKTRGGILAGTFRLGIIPTIAPYILPKILPALQQDFPDLDLKLKETTTPHLSDALIQGQLDAILVALPIHHAELMTKQLFSDPFFLVINSENSSQTTNPTQLLEENNLLLLEEGHCLRDQAISFCDNVSPQALSQFGATSLKTLIELVANNQGITLVPKLAAKVEIPTDSPLRIIPFEPPEPVRTIGLVWRKSSPRIKDFSALAKTITNAIT
ncbi:MAG: LysR family transcriptional regulator [Rhizobiales bacterium]|nr:LysR family transcriptional regulator [Hyphomicrobiales bacterium]